MFPAAIKNFTISYSVGNGRRTFTSGDLMTGHFSFDLTKETKVTSITMQAIGKAKVHWATGGGKNSSRRHFRETQEFFNLRSVILQGDGAVGGSLIFQPGTHVYPFTCQLPQGDFPSSFQGCHGKVAYTISISIHRPWHLSKEFQSEFVFASRFNINQPGLGAPLSGTNSKTLCCLWCASGPITLTASSEKKAFVPGETAKIICDFSNGSSRKATPKVKLKQRQMFYVHNRVNKRMVVDTLSAVTGDVIRAYTSVAHTEIMLPIPAFAALTISNCSIIEVEYTIEVTLSVRGTLGPKVLIPIILCGIPVSAQPPPYSY